MLDIISMGEILIDFTPMGLSDKGNPVFERNPGGAPANVAVQAAHLGGKCAFIGKAGKDQFGECIKATLDEHNVDTRGVVLDEDCDTTLAFVHLDSTGNRNFTFYRRNSADTQLKRTDIDMSMIDEAKLIHFGSLSFTDEPAKTTVLSTVEYAKSKGKIISYDPNWRPVLWKNQLDGIEAMKLGLKFCDVLKVSEEELELITDCKEYENGIKKLFDIGIKIVIVTLGAKGCYLCSKGIIKHNPTYEVKVVDTTGSGDSFFGAFLFKLIESGKLIDDIPFDELMSFTDFANASGALCATKYGAINAMPLLEDVVRIMTLSAKLQG